ncbi:MAG: hypothetical protein ACE5D6_07485, partial [Candidatus Zixiibacteriota bacterium]
MIGGFSFGSHVSSPSLVDKGEEFLTFFRKLKTDYSADDPDKLCRLYYQSWNKLEIMPIGVSECYRNGCPNVNGFSKLSSILSFQALKLSNIRRYSCDDLWCMDRGLGLFAGLNVLPKAAWYSSYSHRVTRNMNISFLKSLHRIWLNSGLLTDTVNLDFVTIPYRGDDAH